MDSSPARSYSSTEQLLPNDLISTNNRNRVAPYYKRCVTYSW